MSNFPKVGIRCCFCARLHPSARAPGATCYPSKRSGIYQAAQNIANTHWAEQCTLVPNAFRNALNAARHQKSTARASKHMWSNRATALGVFEDEDGLRFADSVNALGFPMDDIA
uniref:Uncharacterized protein n=1 Tax=Entomoneis paludosa TaxID=265537 RepID=A0A7S2VDS8_9STRA|mmetsp:Transcript_17655/g.36571  ORF Transcript_17655/g.36571 Transcript_17655/m.36571 type:complete len:114 (+) Transcript_17655:33-374(+)